LLVGSSGARGMAAPVMRVARSARAGAGRNDRKGLVRNGGFEGTTGDPIVGWQAWGSGFRPAPGEGRGGSRAVVCENSSGKGEFGASQTVTLNQRAVAPV